jgi:hypothetical protein
MLAVVLIILMAQEPVAPHTIWIDTNDQTDQLMHDSIGPGLTCRANHSRPRLRYYQAMDPTGIMA